MTSLSQQQLQQAKQIGAQGGTVNTNGMHYTDKNAVNNAVNQGRKGS
ncbi:hypothetical protein [Tateyamaria sp.]